MAQIYTALHEFLTPERGGGWVRFMFLGELAAGRKQARTGAKKENSELDYE